MGGAAAPHKDPPPTRVVVVGAGHAGGTLAALLRQAGYDGDIEVIGAEVHPPYHRPPLSKRFLDADRVQWLRDPGFYAEQAITLSLDESVLDVDPLARRVRTSRRRTVAYDALVLATGARPRTLTLPGLDLDGVMTLRTLDDAERLRDRVRTGPLVVIGGGYVGLEVAGVARETGAEVTVVEREDRVLARVASPALSAILADHHRRRGTTVLLDSHVVGLDGEGSRLKCVRLANRDSGHSAIDAAVAVVGVGAVPCDALAERAGLGRARTGGVLVDDDARTSDPHIWAIGDVTVRRHRDTAIRLESIPSAVEQAKQAAASILGERAPSAEVPWFWSDQPGLKLKIAGVLAPPYETVLRGDPATGRFSLFHHRDNRLIAAETANANADFMAAKRLLADARPVDPTALGDHTVPLRDLAMAGTVATT